MEDAFTWKSNMTPESKDLLKKLSEKQPLINGYSPEIDELGYRSPIEMIVSDMVMKAEDQAMHAVWNVGVNVDKEELVKALAYDRDQYAAGYRYAKEKFDRPHGRWFHQTCQDGSDRCYCSECGLPAKYDNYGNYEESEWCPSCGAQMDEGEGEENA